MEEHDLHEVLTAADMKTKNLNKNTKQLSIVIMKQLLPTINKIYDKNEEIAKNQEVLLESLRHESEKITECNNLNEIELAMAEIKHYHKKLESLKKDMKSLSKIAKDLKQRGLKLQEKKQQQEVKLEEKTLKELSQEQSLIAKHAPSNSVL